MRDVERASRQDFGRRPVQPVPGEVEQRDRHTPIDERRAAQAVLDRRAILRRTGEQSQVDWTTAIAAGECEERARQFVRVFADAAAMAQRRTVIDHDAHYSLLV